MNKAFEKHVTECKEKFREFGQKHRYFLRHVRKESVPKLAKKWFAEIDRLEEVFFDGDDRKMEATSAKIEVLEACAKALCTSKVIGTIIVYYDGDVLRIGFSKVFAGDRYNRHVGIMKAIKDSYGSDDRKVPRALFGPMTDMIEFASSEKGREILWSR